MVAWGLMSHAIPRLWTGSWGGELEGFLGFLGIRVFQGLGFFLVVLVWLNRICGFYVLGFFRVSFDLQIVGRYFWVLLVVV